MNIFLISFKDGGKCRFLPKIYDCILFGQDDTLTE